MIRSFRVGLVSVAVVMMATMAYGQGVITNIKTPPMVESQTIVIPLAYHPSAANPPWAGWAGSLVRFHILDASEMDLDAIDAAAVGNTIQGAGGGVVTNPFGPHSENSQSVGKFFGIITPAAQASGANITPSVNRALANITVHAKNTTPANNSDVDMTMRFWNIFHKRSGFSTNVTILEESDYVWVNSSFPHQGGGNLFHTLDSQFVFPNPLPIGDPNGHWMHLTQTVPFHLTNLGSAFWAKFANTATLGIEHVPEPASGVLLGLGLVSLVLGVRSRRRRLART